MSVAQAVGTISSVLSQLAVETGLPETLIVAADGVVSTPSGVAVATIPVGAQLIYGTSPDRAHYGVSLIGPSFGTSASYDSAIGQVTIG